MIGGLDRNAVARDLRNFLTIAVAATSLGLWAATPPSTVGLLPTDKKGDRLEAGERNPFSKEKVEIEEAVVLDEDDTETEEGRIRKRLETLPVVGQMRGPYGNKLLLGDMILEAGELLPPVIEGQTLFLRVRSINENTAEIIFEEDEGLPQPRTVFIAFDLSPRVTQALAGGAVASGEPISTNSKGRPRRQSSNSQ